MSPETSLSQIVQEAEKLRVENRLGEAAALAAKYATINPETIPNISPDELRDLMRLWRIWAVSLMSLHKRQWNGNKAAEILLQAREVFEKFYHHPRVAEEAQETREDPQGAEYHMYPEMKRDEGKFWQYLAALTGNPQLLAKAIGCFEEAIAASQERTSAWGVAVMEREIAKRLGGEPINWQVFSEAYQTVVELAPQAGGWDRKAAVSWWYVKEAILAGKKQELILGLNNLREACHEGRVNWITRYPLRELGEMVLSLSRRVTLSPEKLTQLEAEE